MEKKIVMKKVFKYIVTYLIIIILFITMLTITSSFSSEKISENVKTSSEVLLKEGNRLVKKIFYRNAEMQFDNYTDALMINTAYSIDSQEPLFSAFVARKNYIPGKTTEIYEDSVGELKSSSKYKYHNEVGELNDLVNDEKAESFEYARYWHGYLIVLRPLLFLFNINQIRIILTILLAVLAILLLSLIIKRINIPTAVIFFTGLLGVEYFYLGYSLQGIFVFIIMMVSSILVLARYDKIKDLGLLFFITGMLTNFFDFLTVPIVTLMIPLILYFLLKQKKEEIDIKSIIIDIIKYSILWGVGYGLTWLTKWILVDCFFDRNLLSVAINQVLYRSVSDSNINTYNMFNVTNENFEYIIVPLFISILSTCFVINIKLLFGKHLQIQKQNVEKVLTRILPYVLLATVPFMWYALLQNHSYYHAFFTYRNLIIANICLNLIIMEVFLSYFKEEKNNEN